MATEKERKLQIEPIVQESVVHNARVLTTIRSLTSSLFGIASGVLGLESYSGFIFYFLGILFVSLLIWLLRADGPQSFAGQPQKIKDEDGDRRSEARLTTSAAGEGQGLYFENPVWELWMGGNELLGGLSSFVLTWTLFYGLDYLQYNERRVRSPLAFKGSSKANGIEMCIGWASNQEDVFPYDTVKCLKARLNIDRPLLNRDLIVQLLNLDHLTLSCNAMNEFADLPTKLMDSELFPKVSKLVLELWAF
ncbi:hypothetical protein G7Y79_00017g042620 [Physcia stellaris]|nr:hypothetical protein G7Y79_00017g042620 [Physcia stellaris]